MIEALENWKIISIVVNLANIKINMTLMNRNSPFQFFQTHI